MLDETKKRLDYIDWAKAISIALIVIGHILPSGCWPKTLAYAFHVPMFAFVGGILFSHPKTFKELGKKLFGIFKRMVIPYVIWFAVSASFYYMSAEQMPDIVKWSAKLVDGVTTIDFNQLVKFFFFYENATLWNDPLWFLPCYIFLSVLFLFFIKLVKGNRIASGVLSFVSFATVVILEKLEVTIDIGEVENVFGLKNYFLMLGFLAAGYALRPVLDKCSKAFKSPVRNPFLYGAAVLFIVFSVLCLKHNATDYPGGYFPLSMYSASYNGFLSYILFALILSFTLLLALMLLPKFKIANLLSRNSLFIMCTHYFFFTYDMTFHFLTKNKWVEVAQKLEVENWELSMNLGIRDAVFILALYVLFFFVTDAIQRGSSKTRVARVSDVIFTCIGLK